MLKRIEPWFWVLAAILLSRFIGMALFPLVDTTEPRYAEIARLMAETGDWITPWFEPGVPFWGKPPLSFWAQAASLKIFGLSEFSLRLPAWFATIGIVWLTWCLSKLARGVVVARWSTLVLSTMALTYISAGAVMTDTFLVFGTTLSLVSVWFVLAGRSDFWRWLFFVGLAIGLLAKGPLALILTSAPLVLWAAIFRQRLEPLKRMPWLLGSLLTLVIALPWYVLAELKTPGFLNYFIIGEHFSRFLDPGWAGDLYGSAHDRTKGMIWIFWLWASFPWGIIGLVGFGFAAARGRTKDIFSGAVQDASTLYLLFCAITPMMFFTLAGNTLWTYILPSLPFSAILIAGWASRVDFRPWSRIRSGAVLLAPVLTTLFVFIGLSGVTPLKTEKQLISRYESIQQSGDSPIFYIGEMPFSARFYSLGDAVEVTSTEFDSLLESAGYARVFAAIPNDEVDEFLDQQSADARKVGENKRYQLFYVDLQPTNSQNGAINPELNSKNG
jgi:4-amino-4-deoxy-L-arabinose transferase-like glycosyltransferase